MHIWFETVVKYEKVCEEGKVIKVSEKYLVDALSHAEAENRIIQEMKPFISGEFSVSKVARKKITEFFTNETADKWYQAKIHYLTLDEEKGIEKRISVNVLVQASDISEAVDGIIIGMHGSMADYEIMSVSETQIIDIFEFKPE